MGATKIDDESDWVRLEIATALSDPLKTVIPILVRAAKMPPAHALPNDVAGVTAKQAIEVPRDHWDHHVALVTDVVNATRGTDMLRVDPTTPLLDTFWCDL